jgi:hypothetical protein|nr:MAG TPA: hypothetical protein [Caudoviricetes sp.]
MVNNLDYIKFRLKEVFDLNNKDLFFHVLILQRKKEVDGINKNSNVIKSYAVKDLEYLENKLNNEIIPICNSQNARAMINLNPKSFKRVSHSILRRLSEYIENDFYEGTIIKLFDSCASSSSINKELGIEKYWLVDVDYKDIEIFRKVQSIINFCEPIKPNIQKVKGFTNSKNGYHIYTTPFNLKTFESYKIRYKNIEQVEIKKDCLTNLYIP